MRIFLVGLSAGISRSLTRYVSHDPRLALAGSAPSLALAGASLRDTEPDVVLVDWAGLNRSARQTMGKLREGRPALRIVCVASEAEAYYATAAHAGADAVISNSALAEELESLLRAFFPGCYGPAGGKNE